jgi:hypothetical protein
MRSLHTSEVEPGWEIKSRLSSRSYRRPGLRFFQSIFMVNRSEKEDHEWKFSNYLSIEKTDEALSFWGGLRTVIK